MSGRSPTVTGVGGASTGLLDQVRVAHEAGLCVLPVAADGSKRPAARRWRVFQTIRPTPAQMRAWHFERRAGFGLIAGPVSGYRLAWDFDGPNIYQAFVAAAEASGLADLVRRIEAGYCDETPSGGRRWIVHCSRAERRQDVLARRPGAEGEPSVKTLIELPTFAILAPSSGPTHPTGRPYVRLSGGFTTIATLTPDEHADLVVLARTFDAMGRPHEAEHRLSPTDGSGNTFDHNATWREILEPFGWRHVYDRGGVGYWCRPGKRRGVSATTNHGGMDRLHVFSSSTPFTPNHSYSKLTASVVLRRGSMPVTPPDPASDGRARCQRQPIVVLLQDVQPESVTWLWPGRLGAGKVALLVGDPGLGKSWIALDLAARLSTGRTMPDGCGGADGPGDALLLSAEDGMADTIRPRLDALGANVARIHALTLVRAGQHELAVSIADIDALELAIRKTGARLVIVDPLSAFLGAVDSHRDGAVRGLLAPVAALAERTSTAVLGIMHLAKETQRPAIHRAVGSIAFAAAARIVLAVATDPTREDRRIMAALKSNLSARPPALAYALTDGRLMWEPAPIAHVDVEQLLAGSASSRNHEEQTEAEALVSDLLDDVSAWPLDARDALAAGHARGIYPRALRRAAHRLGVRVVRRGFGRGGRWIWERPVGAAIGDIGAIEASGEIVSPMSPMDRERGEL
jgi:hypothetical protein